MKWIAGLGKQLGNLLSSNDPVATGGQRLREHVVSLGLQRILGQPADPATLATVLDRQRKIDAIHHQIREQSAPSIINYDGLSQLKPFQQNQQGYLLVYVQGFLTAVLQHLIRTPQARHVAHVVFQPHENPAAHVSVLERGHGLAFELPFFPLENDAAILCPFFGELAAVSLKATAFAVQNRASVLPIWARLDDDQGLTLEIAPPLEGHNSPEGLALALLAHFERRIRSAPAEMDWEADCWYPPARRLLPSRFPWKLASEADGARIDPLRLLLRVPDSVREACLAVPAVRALKRGRPDVHLSVLTTAEMADFWNLLQECDACLALDSDGDDETAYDLGILLNSEKQSLSQLQRHAVHRTIGMETHPAASQFDEVLTMPRKLGPPEHRHRTYLRVAHRLGAEVIHDADLRAPMLHSISHPQPAEMKVPAPGKKRSQKKRGNGKRGKQIKSKSSPSPVAPRLMGMAPDASDGSSYAWAPERFIDVARRTAQENSFSWRIFLHPETETEAWEALIAELPDKDIALVTTPATLEERLKALAACRVVLANDNDDLHLAATVRGTPTIAIYGPSDPIQTAPVAPNALVLRRHVECTPCFLAECPLDHRCLNEIEVPEVIEALHVSLSQPAANNG